MQILLPAGRATLRAKLSQFYITLIYSYHIIGLKHKGTAQPLANFTLGADSLVRPGRDSSPGQTPLRAPEFHRETLRVNLRNTNMADETMTSNGFAIRAERVSRRYRMGEAVIRAVNEISLNIGAGEFLALLGASGSGKSTLLNLMAGLDRPTSGAILALGRDLAAMSSEELAQHRNRTIGMVFQSFQLLPRMTLEENVELPLRLAEVPRGERPERVRDALQRVGLSARTRHRPTELSGGEQQRAAIARALVNQPQILLADEPTGNLDSKTGDEIMSLIAGIHRPPSGPGRTVVMVTHERQLAERYADRIVTLSDGAISSEERLR